MAQLIIVSNAVIRSDSEVNFLTNFTVGLFILLFLISAAGQLADRFDKALLMRKVKFCEIMIVLLATFSLFNQKPDHYVVHSFSVGNTICVFGPLKCSIVPTFN